MQEGKLLGHIISKEGIKMYFNRVEAILNIRTLRSKKEVQSFLGKVIFLRRFIPNLDEIIKYTTIMFRKGNGIKWTLEARKSFEYIKVALTKAPVFFFFFFWYLGKSVMTTVFGYHVPQGRILVVFLINPRDNHTDHKSGL
jgi:hypothetical protein